MREWDRSPVKCFYDLFGRIQLRSRDGIARAFEDRVQSESIANVYSIESLSRRELFIWLAAILCATAFTETMALGGFSLEHLARLNAFQILGWWAALRLLFLREGFSLATKLDFWVTGVVGAIILLPANRVVWIATSLAAIYIYVRSVNDSNGRTAASVLAALSVQSLWGPTIFSLFAIHLLRVDAALVGVALDLTRSGYVWHDNVIMKQGHSVEIYNGCSSFHNVSLAGFL